MDAFLDLFGLKRRDGPRVAVNWLIDIKVPDSDAYIGFFARDISADGIRIQGNSLESLQRILSAGKRVRMNIRAPGRPAPLEVGASLKWGPTGDQKPQAGWTYTQIDKATRQYINGYIDDHPEDVLEEKD